MKKLILTLFLLIFSTRLISQIIPYDSSIERSTLNFVITGSSNGFYYGPFFQKSFRDSSSNVLLIARVGVDFKAFNSDLDYLNQHRFYVQTPIMKEFNSGISIGIIPIWFESPLPRPSYETYGGTLPDGTVIKGSNPNFYGYWTPSSIVFNFKSLTMENRSKLKYEIQFDKYWDTGNITSRFKIVYEFAYLKGI